jgi:hypothetical protein
MTTPADRDIPRPPRAEPWGGFRDGPDPLIGRRRRGWGWGEDGPDYGALELHVADTPVVEATASRQARRGIVSRLRGGLCRLRDRNP